MVRWSRAAAGFVLAIACASPALAHADPNALWQIVSGQCVPDQEQHGVPAPCADVDLSAGEDKGTAVLKDLVGATQFLLIPTGRVTGIESPELLAPDAPNYFASAWRARSFVDERAGWTLPRDWVSLAINSEDARTQDQLHIHVDCVRRDVHEALTRHRADVGSAWAPFPVPLVGHRYSAIAVEGEDLDVNLFQLLADGIKGAQSDMGAQTLVVVGAYGPDGQPGFIVLADHVDVAAGDTAGGEALQDHMSCPQPK
ncbi:MAG: CDP-diacylglycerol pyrophosphatase [Mycobacterium sp.]|jgi:CDP-diacylglycerol pyrophosphatase|nr:CDP-diacylglycerol pyrophosphatase [Mycobacterium sp.]MDT5247886.1 CDP-diacylglycerol pyrophosphatase [Mycobacterium sp.]